MRLWRKFATCCILISIALTIVLLVKGNGTMEVFGCSQGGDCDAIISSRWSNFLGLPVALFAIVSYGVLLILLLLRKEKLRALTFFLCAINCLAAAWFIILQAFVLHKFCIWCSLTHFFALLGSSIIIIHINTRSLNKRQITAWTSMALSVVALMATIQTFGSRGKSYKTSKDLISFAYSPESGLLQLYGSELEFNVKDLPYIGKTQGEQDLPIILLTDYTCPHCREYLLDLMKSEESFTKIHMLPGYYNQNAREIHRNMMILWKVDRVAYSELTGRLARLEIKADQHTIITEIKKYFGEHYLLYVTTHSKWVQEMIELGEKVRKLNEFNMKTISLPQIIIRGTVVEGTPTWAELKELNTKNTHLSQTTMSQASGSREPKTHYNKTNEFATLHPNSANLGSVAKWQVRHGDFTIKNTSDEPLKIVRIAPTCGCITVQRTPFELLPNEEKSLAYAFDTTKFNGPVVHYIALVPDKGPTIRFPVRVKVWQPFYMKPPVLNFGKAVVGQSTRKKKTSLVLQNKQPINITEIHCDDQSLTIQLTEIVAGRHYEVSAQINSMTDGKLHTKIELETDSKECPKMYIPVYASSAPPVVLSVNKLSIKQLIKSKKLVIYVTCYDLENAADFAVTEAMLTGLEGVKIKTVKIKENWKVQLSVENTAMLHHLSDKDCYLALRTNHPDYQILKLPVVE